MHVKTQNTYTHAANFTAFPLLKQATVIRCCKLLFVLCFIGLLGACNPETEDKSNQEAEAVESNPNELTITKERFEALGAQLGKLEKRNLKSEIKANGVIDVPPQNMASISAPLGGFVKRTDLLPGDYVKKGAMLAIIQHTDYLQLQQDYLQAVSQLQFLQQDFNRQTELDEGNVGTKKKLQQSRTEYEVAKALVQTLEVKLHLAGIPIGPLKSGKISPVVSIVAPISGYIKSVNVNIGKYVNPTDVMFEIVNKDHLHLELKVFERDIFKIKEGQDILFTVPNRNAEEMTAKVHLIGKVFEGDSKSINIHGHLEPERSDLIPGMYVSARILTSDLPSMTLPEAGVIRQGDKDYVFVKLKQSANEYVFRKQQVTVGVTQAGLVQIELPKSVSGSEFVVKGAYFMAAEMAGEDEE